MAGFIVLLTSVLLLYGAIFGEPDPSSLNGETPDVATDSQKLAGKFDLSASLTMNEFMTLVSTAKPDELDDFLVAMNSATNVQASVPVRIEQNRKRVKAAEQLMLLDCTRAQYELAAMSKLLGLSAIYNLALEANVPLEVTEESDQLLRFAHSLTTDSSSSLKLHGGLTVLGLRLLDVSKQPDALSKTDEMLELTLKLLRDFSDSPEVILRYLEQIYPRILQHNQDFGLEYATRLLQHRSEIQSEQAQQFFRDLYDSTVLLPMKLPELLDSGFVLNEAHYQKLLGHALQLASNPKTGEKARFELEKLTHWLEQNEKLDDAKRIYEKVLEIAPQRETPKLVFTATKDANDGLQRCQAVGKKIEFNAKLIEGPQLESSHFENSFVVIIFMSYGQPDFLRRLEEISVELSPLSNQNVKYLVVIMEEEISKNLSKLTSRFSGIQFVSRQRVDEQTPSLFEQYPAHIIPQAIIVDPRRVVVRSALKPLDITENVKKKILEGNSK